MQRWVEMDVRLVQGPEPRRLSPQGYETMGSYLSLPSTPARPPFNAIFVSRLNVCTATMHISKQTIEYISPQEPSYSAKLQILPESSK